PARRVIHVPGPATRSPAPASSPQAVPFRAKLSCIAVTSPPRAAPATRQHPPGAGPDTRCQGLAVAAVDDAGRRHRPATAVRRRGNRRARARRVVARAAGALPAPAPVPAQGTGTRRRVAPAAQKDRGGTRVKLATLDIAIVLAY